ncbi:hypothetical protein ACFQZE_19240 [Paenibacillus sp. GCM10027627]|uniref:hypothetical protein n=1 Tax=unclassified Paenibacillus TaxID=185978 RepID=UPI0036420B7D
MLKKERYGISISLIVLTIFYTFNFLIIGYSMFLNGNRDDEPYSLAYMSEIFFTTIFLVMAITFLTIGLKKNRRRRKISGVIFLIISIIKIIILLYFLYKDEPPVVLESFGGYDFSKSVQIMQSFYSTMLYQVYGLIAINLYGFCNTMISIYQRLKIRKDNIF